MLASLPHIWLFLHLTFLTLPNLDFVPFLVAAQQLSEGTSCPVTGPFSDSGTCATCQDTAACIRETGRFEASCFKGVEFSGLAQVKSYRCNLEGPPDLADAVQPGAFIQCNISSVLNTSPAAAGNSSSLSLSSSCTFGLVVAGDPVVCTATECTTQTNSTVVRCQASSCDCSLTTGCTSEFATQLVQSLSGPLSWGCEVPPGGLTSLTNPAECTWKAAGLPGGPAQAICDVGECTRAQGPQKHPDVDKLMEFKRSFTNGEELLADWRPGGNPCDWVSVSCTYLTNEVQSLLLSNKGLEGKLPPSDAMPKSLLLLDLNDNSISGSIPATWSLPEGLRQLNLARNRLTGSIPATWSLPSSLLALDLARNQLNGSLSAAWQLPEAMTFISASENQLTGGLLVAWVLPSSLNRISLWNNKLSGEVVPEGLVLPARLEWYEVNGNQFVGNFTEVAGRLPPRLTYLDLGGNNITGMLPPKWNLPTTLQALSISYTLLSGTIPSTWEPHPSLTVMLLFGNRLTGTLPSWPELVDLNVTVLPSTGLCGKVPSVPRYMVWRPGIDPTPFMSRTPLESLPACVEQSDISPNEPGGGSSNMAALVGGLAGGCAVLAVALGMALWRRARRRAVKQPDIEEHPTEREVEESASSALHQTSEVGGGEASGSALGSGAEGAIEGPASQAQSHRSAIGAKRASDTELGGTGAGVVAPPGQGQPGRAAGDMQQAVRRGPPPPPYSLPLLPGQNQEEQLDTPSVVSSGGVRGSMRSSSKSFSAASKDLLASDPLLSSIVVQLKEGASRNPGSSGGGAGTGPGHGFHTLELPGTEELSGRERMPPPQGLVPGVQHRRSTATGSSTSHRQLVDVGIWQVDFMDLLLIRQIGSGSFGRVYLGVWRETLVAVKLLLGEAAAIGNINEAVKAVLSVSDPLLNNLKKEASLMAALRHPNVLGFMGLCTMPPCLISEYCPRGSLYDTLKSAKQFTTRALELTWSIRLQMVTGAAKGMYYLHLFKPPIIHRDLKSNNLLIEENWNTKVADFNLSKIMEVEGPEGFAVASSIPLAAGNPRWLAPEVIVGEPHTFASDSFSFGIILWEVLTWEVPWASLSFWQVTANVQEGLRLPIQSPEDLPGAEKVFPGLDRYIALLKRCWAQKPAERPTFGEIVTELREIQEEHIVEPA